MVQIATDPRYRPILLTLIRQQGQPISLDEIAERTNFGLTTIKRHLWALRDHGVVVWPTSRGGRGKRSSYVVDRTVERLVIAS